MRVEVSGEIWAPLAARDNGSVKLFWRSKGSKAAPEGLRHGVH